jgi:hypothetical protein
MTQVDVWYKLDGGEPATVEVQHGIIVDRLKKAIKADWAEHLDCAAAQLEVYTADETPLRPDTVVPDTNYDTALIIKTPPPQKQDDDEHIKRASESWRQRWRQSWRT